MHEKPVDDEHSTPYLALARKALRAYGLEDAVVLLLRADTDISFDVRTPGTFPSRHLLRIRSAAGDSRVLRRELSWLTALRRDTDLVVPEPILTRTGLLLHSVSHAGVSGARTALLLRWVEGDSPGPQFPPEDAARLGQAIARLHCHGGRYGWPTDVAPPRVTADDVRSIADGAALRTQYPDDALCTIRKALDVLAGMMRDLGVHSSVAGAIHGNLQLSQVVCRGSDEPGLINFKRCTWGHFAFDLSRLVFDLRSRGNGDELIDALLTGYRSVRPLSESAEAALPAFYFLHRIAEAQRAAASKEDGEVPQIAELAARALHAARQLLADP